MSAEATEVILGVSARYAEQIRELIEARARERLAAREEAARKAERAEAARRATEQAVRIDVRAARPATEAAATVSELPRTLPSGSVPVAPDGQLQPSPPAPAATPTQSAATSIRPGGVLDAQV
jgi:hypothetical protein